MMCHLGDFLECFTNQLKERKSAYMNKEFDISKIDLTNLRKLRARHKVIYDGKNFKYRRDALMTQYTNVDDITLKRAPLNTLEGVANQLLLDAERKEQGEARRQAKRYDRSYIEKADYSIMSLYSDLKTEIEYGNMTWHDYRAERKKWRRCKYKFCLNMFPIDKNNFIGKKARRKDSRFCCDACRTAEHESNNRFLEHGSYLPVKVVEGRLSESVGDNERKKTIVYEAEDLENAAYHNEYVQPIKGVNEQMSIKYHEELLKQTFDYPSEKSLYK